MEIRSNEQTITASDNKIGGLMLPYNQASVIHDQGISFRETVRPGAIAHLLKEQRSIWVIIKHNRNERIGRYPATLQLRETDQGVHGDLSLPPGDFGNRIVWDVANKNYVGWSWGFRNSKDKWSKGAIPEREIYSMDVEEFTLTDVPSYSQTSVETREQASKFLTDNFSYYRTKLWLAEIDTNSKRTI